ncbi:MAG TPA: alternative ribosome rescue aminoacyl-tRNA hydrolase ArfB [Planctomycetota bacterium]|nr:alternative ribosome rescue aminoacyl-tRNA hydrolase ArfB [Planctomycetota bacterium]HRR79762.1 alternative ribosome rescue aminoacyl-tRNA hydrolase ArfB [Planctomycetota bacterium]HRT96835.1 alternative ribosome rescue aminoacyl-tRNA hydrolase ArfB [Planctomycetota bacterium]
MGDGARVAIQPGVAIPLAELAFRFTRSSGPGGQHVNKAATQAELAFDVAGSPSLSAEQKQRLIGRLGGYVSKEGVLRITCQSSRSQAQNREEALERFAVLLRAALHVPRTRRRTRPPRAAAERRLAAKRRRSELKRGRGAARDDS